MDNTIAELKDKMGTARQEMVWNRQRITTIRTINNLIRQWKVYLAVYEACASVQKIEETRLYLNQLYQRKSDLENALAQLAKKVVRKHKPSMRKLS